jgi:predicted Zn-dependent protease
VILVNDYERAKTRHLDGQETGMSRARRSCLSVLCALVVAALLFCILASWNYRRARRAIAEARKEIEAGLHATAAQKLNAVLAEKPDSGEAAYLLGTCEKATGRNRPAALAWERVPPSSPFAPRAIQRLMELEVEGGRFAAAEELVKRAMERLPDGASALPLYLGPIYWLQGRIDEAEQSIELRWRDLNDRGEGASEKAIDLVRLHIEFRRNPLPVDVVRQGLDDAGRLAPDDDRVWLGKANLAIRTGSFEEAERWLDACIRRRPRDLAVWQARLSWALAANRVTEGWEAMKHLPVAVSRPAQIPRLAAWLAAQRGDRVWERRALDRLVEIDPTDFVARDRLDLLATDSDRATRTAALRQHKIEIERLHARYQDLYQRYQPIRDAAEMAALADKLGRRFEAIAFKTLALAVDPSRDDFLHDLARMNRPADELGQSMAELIGEDQGSLTDQTKPRAVHGLSTAPIPPPNLP